MDTNQNAVTIEVLLTDRNSYKYTNTKTDIRSDVHYASVIATSASALPEADADAEADADGADG
jgi:hypothetical protein